MSGLIFDYGNTCVRSPYLDCERRAVRCHTGCAEYAAFRERIESEKSKIRTNKAADRECGIYKRAGAIKAINKKRKDKRK